ncbi:PAS domain-containing protein [Costertonia aggregata]|uniref:histidine kinase n=1 Tax=Costertonia aggregata TaxID=343403 RepID=A0A7H9ALL6_9FLAO|nr:PAS domain-containing protein [Costertonia aggregata]QLG44273.1 PAS domain S-box protein [Costertonia aggregata]
MLGKTKINTNNYLIKQLPKATAFLNKKLEIVHVSDRLIHDYCPDKTNILGQPFPNLFKNLEQKLKKSIGETIKGKQNPTTLERFLNDNSNEVWLEFENIPWFDENENIIGAIVQINDVTEKAKNQKELDKLKVLFNEKSEIGKIGSWEYDAVKDTLTWCNMTRKIHDVPPNFIPEIETAIDFYKAGFSKNTIAMQVDSAMKKGTPWKEKLQIVTFNGDEKWVISAGRPIFQDKKFVGLIGTFQDVDDQVKSECKTKESEQLLKTLIDNLPLNVFIKDLDSKKILVNKSECNYLGVRSKDIIGKDDFDLYPEDIAQKSRDEDLKVINTLKPILGKETISIKNDGTQTYFLTSKIPLLDSDGSATGLVGISLDISDIKQKEEELHSLINVASLQNKKLVNFAHIVSHNLRSHTANFSMLLDFLVNEKSEDEKKNIINMLVEASDNLLETLDNLNEVVAINTNVNQDKKPIRLNDKIKTVEKNLTALLINNYGKIINTISDDTHIKVIPAYIESILMNFMTNAIKYKDPHRDPVIKLSAERKGKYTVMSISDNGLGIDLDKYGDKLFGMYKTFHNNSDAKGIGLYITKNQIEAMNGKIEVYSKVGQGTTFKIFFNEQD